MQSYKDLGKGRKVSIARRVNNRAPFAAEYWRVTRGDQLDPSSTLLVGPSVDGNWHIRVMLVSNRLNFEGSEVRLCWCERGVQREQIVRLEGGKNVANTGGKWEAQVEVNDPVCQVIAELLTT